MKIKINFRTSCTYGLDCKILAMIPRARAHKTIMVPQGGGGGTLTLKHVMFLLRSRQGYSKSRGDISDKIFQSFGVK